ncbi:MAG: hypothetical protein RBR70_05340 [Arcobacter sp.]|jgi:hypothetical protein|uniref:hypothetical protein n=1 Tax=Arcobacter sp. TaxID=1872629 RepID=UPI002A754E5D|nr:hypothetical protein [Arcobacter sp.]MDY3204477.1 hypothetical protein [Arcobacter sp.]
MKILIILFLVYNSVFAVDFAIITITDNEALNYFFSFPIWTLIISLPFIAILNLIKKI